MPVFDLNNQHARTRPPLLIHRKYSSSTAAGSRSSSFAAADHNTITMSVKKLTSSPTMTPDRVDRTSFSSVKETNSGIAQSFTDSKTSSYLRNEILIGGDVHEEAVFDDLSSGTRTPEEERVGVLGNGLTESRLKGFVCPCDGFKGWKGISVKGRVASKSYGDLKSLGRWDWEVKSPEREGERSRNVKSGGKDGKSEAGKSPIERLPMELLGSIIDQLATDIPPNGFTARNIDLMSLLITSRTMHSATLSTLYNQITIPHSRIFRKFLSHIKEYPALGTIVRRIDFSHFNPTGAGMTARQRAETLNLTTDTLLQCLKLTPNLREFLAQEHIDDELSLDVLKALFSLPKIKAVDLCACSSPNFKAAFTTLAEGLTAPALSITRLSLHECSGLPASVFTNILPRLPHLTHLDVAHTRITDEALFLIPETARLTHLNLAKCAGLTGDGVVTFLTTHPAAKDLIYLNLSVDVKSHDLLSADNITALLPQLPSTLRSLNFKGSKMDNTHIPLVLPLTKHLEELGLGRHLNLKDITRLFVPTAPADTDPAEIEVATAIAYDTWVPHTLHYIDVSDLNATELDLSTLFSSSSPLLTQTSQPLGVLELSTEVYQKLSKSQANLKRVGWRNTDMGRRGWIVRDEEKVRLQGGRGWKWGATHWGARKIPVARADVGGMYGHYMFKR